jgi:hypothetical protein
MTKQQIIDKLIRGCEARELTFASAIYEDEIDNAIETVNGRRGFTPTEEIPFEERYSNLIYEMALYSLSKMGAEGEKIHNENGINRSYASGTAYPNELLNRIIPLVKGV